MEPAPKIAKKVVSYRTTTPFDNSGGLSPTTPKSTFAPMFGGTPSLQDIVEKSPMRPNDITGRGNWGDGKDVNKMYREEGDEYMRETEESTKAKERALDRYRGQKKGQWIVEMESGEIYTFPSYQVAMKEMSKMKEPYRTITKKTAQALSDKKPKAISDAIRSCVTVKSSSGEGGELGAGFCVGPGVFVTCAHVIMRYDKFNMPTEELPDHVNITLTLGEETSPATLISIDYNTDIAVLKSPMDLPSLALVPSANIEVGEDVFAVGSPRGFANNVTDGILSAKDRKIFWHEGAPLFLFTDADVLPGNSGGPLITYSTGEVIGMMSVIVGGEDGGVFGLNAAVPSEIITKNLKDSGLNL
jgi:S1-C subfamily serine protease